MDARIINVDPNIFGGKPVFDGTRVPIQNLFDYIESGHSADLFLEDFKCVSREQVTKVLEISQELNTTSSTTSSTISE
jgi:uncharacterized protein (DUF433 family)